MMPRAQAELLEAIEALEGLYSLCGWRHEAEGLRQYREAISRSRVGSAAFRAVLADLKHNLVGMGSISDVPYPPSGTPVDRADVERSIWRLVDRIGTLCDALSE